VTLQGWPSSDAAVAAYRRPLRWQDPAPLTTGDDGRFAFSPKPLPPLGWDLFVRAPGRAAAHRRWWKLAADRAEKPCEIKLLREFAVRAAAVTAEGAPAAGATVQLSVQLAPDKAGQSTRYVRAISDAGGNLDFPPLPVGSHRVSNWLEGAWRVVGRPVLQLGAHGNASGTRIVVAAQEATITGRVLDDAGTVLPGVELRASTGDWESGGDLGKAITDAAGRFVLGRHRDPPGAPVQLVLGDGSVLSPAPTWNAPARDFVAKRAGHVRLRVLDAQDNPVQRYAVEWVGGHKPARVGSIGGHHVGGEADLGACAAGTCYLDVLPGGDDLGRAGLVTIEVAPASTHTAVVKLTPPVRRTVRVATSAGEPVTGAGVVFVVVPPDMPVSDIEKKVTMARQPGGGAQQAWTLVQTKTNHEAQATVTLPVGLTRYALVVHAEHLVRAQSIYDLDVTKPHELIDVVLTAGATLRGRVLPADFAQHAARLLRVDAGQLVVEARSLLRPHDNRQGALRGDAFELRGLAPGTYELALGRSFWANVPLARQHVEVHGDGTRDEVLDLRRLVPATLKGRVVAGGQPAAHAKVRVFGPHWSLPGDVTTDDAGHFTCEAVLPGLLWVRAEKVGMDPEPIEATPGGVHERTFHVAGASVTLRLQRGGVPVRDGMFTLLLQPHEVFVASSHIQDERIVFAGVPPGSYVVRSALPGRKLWCGEFELEAGRASMERDVTLGIPSAPTPR
jgi:hypothetical protein